VIRILARDAALSARLLRLPISNFTTLATLLVPTTVRNNCQLGIVLTCEETA